MRKQPCALWTTAFAVLLSSLLIGCREETAPRPDVRAPSLIQAEDFMLRNQSHEILAPSIIQYRTPHQRWTEEEIEVFWTPVREIGVEWLREESDKEIERLLETIP